LIEHPAVAQAVAFALPHPTLGEDVAAAVVLKQKIRLTRGRSVNFCSSACNDL